MPQFELTSDGRKFGSVSLLESCKDTPKKFVIHKKAPPAEAPKKFVIQKKASEPEKKEVKKEKEDVPWRTGKMPITLYVDDKTGVPLYAQTDSDKHYVADEDEGAGEGAYAITGIKRGKFSHEADLFIKLKKGKYSFFLESYGGGQPGQGHKATTKTITIVRK